MKETVFKVVKSLLVLFLLFCYSVCIIGIIGVLSVGTMWMLAQWGEFWYFVGVIAIFVVFVGTTIYLSVQEHKDTAIEKEVDDKFLGLQKSVRDAKESQLDDLNKDSAELDKKLELIGKELANGGTVTLSKDKMDKETK